uniref:Uncharacterized protein n=1 Tax=Lynx canadensis TaxID=61383 RepID=A0A667G5X3_LYNCA
MGHNGSWISRNASEPRNASGAEAGGANRSALGELGEVQLYRQFTTTVQVVIFIGSLLGSLKTWPALGFVPAWCVCLLTSSLALVLTVAGGSTPCSSARSSNFCTKSSAP